MGCLPTIVEVGSLSHIIYRVLYIPADFPDKFLKPSTVSLSSHTETVGLGTIASSPDKHWGWKRRTTPFLAFQKWCLNKCLLVGLLVQLMVTPQKFNVDIRYPTFFMFEAGSSPESPEAHHFGALHVCFRGCNCWFGALGFLGSPENETDCYLKVPSESQAPN